ncbi:MAG: hypothetical protein WD800_05645, partial [Dehalococcoidia bacterium]
PSGETSEDTVTPRELRVTVSEGLLHAAPTSDGGAYVWSDELFVTNRERTTIGLRYGMVFVDTSEEVVFLPCVGAPRERLSGAPSYGEALYWIGGDHNRWRTPPGISISGALLVEVSRAICVSQFNGDFIGHWDGTAQAVFYDPLQPQLREVVKKLKLNPVTTREEGRLG